MADFHMTELAELATVMHEFYTELVKAGFTEYQAITIVAKVITENQTKDKDD